MITNGLLAIALLGASLSAQERRGSAIDPSKLVDLSYAFDEKTLFWPTAKPFEWRKDAWGKSAGGYWYASATFTTSEHGGTHLDSPIHFGEGKWANDEIPLSRLIAAADVVDISAACAKDRDYRLTAGDLTAWEKKHGGIRAGEIVLIRSGWGKYWPDRKKYFGSDKPGDVSDLHFPGISKAAAELLVKRGVAGAGLDTPSLDHGPSKDFIVHQVLNGANVFGLENVANLERVPETGATLIALPVKVKGGTGGPVRIVAVLP